METEVGNSKNQRKQKPVVSSSLPRGRDRLPLYALPGKVGLEVMSKEANCGLLRGAPATAAPASLLWVR